MTSALPLDEIAIVNARVWTGDARRPWADAVLLRGDQIEVVGSSAEVKKRAGPSAKTLDAKGMLVTPAFSDGWAPEPLTTLIEALHDSVSGSSREGLPAHDIGTLRVGMRADLVVVDRDITRATPEEIRAARVMLMMREGRVVYDRAGLLTV